MTELTILEHAGQPVVDSREVAAMIGRQHKDLMRSIREYSGTIEKSAERNFAPSDFFIESTYINSQNKEQPCYLLTKKGCDLVANKMTGEKGVLFTAVYVTAFERMREHIQTGKPQLRKSDLEIAAETRRAEAMLLNAKARTARQLLALWSQAGVPAGQQALALGDLYAANGVRLPALALQGCVRETFDKGTIAQQLGVLSKAGLPHAQAVGAIIRTLELSPDEVEHVPYARNGHDGVDTQYTDTVVQKVRAWLAERHWPNPICVGGKAYQARYAQEASSE